MKNNNKVPDNRNPGGALMLQQGSGRLFLASQACAPGTASQCKEKLACQVSSWWEISFSREVFPGAATPTWAQLTLLFPWDYHRLR